MPAGTDNRDSLSLVREFHEAFEVPMLSTPGIPHQDRCDLRSSLLQEELEELKQAIANKDIVGVFDALTDIQYVLDGTYLEFGLADLKQAGLLEVHRSNMSKLGENGKPILRSDGKVLKGSNYTPPDLASILLAEPQEA